MRFLFPKYGVPVWGVWGSSMWSVRFQYGECEMLVWGVWGSNIGRVGFYWMFVGFGVPVEYGAI